MDISREQEHLIFLRIELDACQDVVARIKADGNKTGELAYYEAMQKDLVNRIFELEILTGISV